MTFRRPSAPATRSGTILIIVAGLSALMLSMALAFIMNMRADMDESEVVQREAQARIVLIAALHYIQESSRMGWDRPGTPEHEEAFGWTDIRDGSAGPKDSRGVPLYNPTGGVFPAIGGRAGRFMLHALERPPFAITTAFAPNAAPLKPTLPWKDLIGYTSNDPQPAALTWAGFASGNKDPRTDSYGRSWFRIYRDRNPAAPDAKNPPVEPATFTITCGAGGTLGFKDYQEVIDLGQTELFNHDAGYFAVLRSQERILWFRTEWTPAVGGSSMGVRVKPGYWELPTVNNDASPTDSTLRAYPDIYKNDPVKIGSTQWWVNRNLVGSFLYIQRLTYQPTIW
jgi:hypothetical protein